MLSVTATLENVGNLILEHLQALRADSAGIREDIQEITQRPTGLGVAVGSIKPDLFDVYTEKASQHIRYDRLAARIEKIERRLELNWFGDSTSTIKAAEKRLFAVRNELKAPFLWHRAHTTQPVCCRGAT